MVTTFGVALFTILVQGLSFEPIVNFLKVKQSNPTERKGEALREELNELENDVRKLISSNLPANEINKAKKQLKSKIDQTQKLILKLEEDDINIADIERIQIEKLLAHAQQDCLNTLARQDKVSKSIIKEFRARVNQELDSLKIDTPPVQEHAPFAELTELGETDSADPDRQILS